MSDDDFVTEVRGALRLGVADLTASPSLLPTLRRRHARQVAARRVAITAASLAVAVAVGGVAATAGIGPSGPTHEVRDAAVITDQVAGAMDGAGRSVVFITVTETGVGKVSTPDEPAVWNHWYRADNTAVRTQVLVDGQPVWDEGTDLDRRTTTTVDHRQRTWRSGPFLVRAGDATGDMITPAGIRQAMAGGRLTIVGEGELVAGRPTIHLRGDGIAHSGDPMGFWVDRTSHLPIRAEYRRGNSWQPPFDLTWLPPTEANLANLTIPIPAGYSRQG